MINKLKKNIFAFPISFLFVYFLLVYLVETEPNITNKQTAKTRESVEKEVEIIDKIEEIVLKNSLLTTNLDIDYIETLIRTNLSLEKMEKIYIINENED